MKNIGRVLRRTLKSEFGPRKNPLPQNLEFLQEIPFYAVTACKPPNSDSIQTRIEILPASLRKMAHSFVENKELKKMNEEVSEKLLRAKVLFDELQDYISALEKANSQLMLNLGEGPSTPRSEIRSYLQVAEEIGFIVRGPNYQGGLPSLGKKS